MWAYKLFIKNLNTRTGIDSKSEVNDQLLTFLNKEKIKDFQVIRRKLDKDSEVEILEVMYFKIKE